VNGRSSTLNRLLTVFFAILVAIQAFYLLLGIAGLPRYYVRVTTETVQPVVYYGQEVLSNDLVAEFAAERGLSLGQYATYRIVFSLAMALIPVAVAAVLVWKARGQWFAWFTAFVILFLGEAALSEPTFGSRLISTKLFGINVLFWFLVLLYLFLFPSGTAVPRRAGWLVGGLVLYHFFIQAGTVVAYVAPEIAVRLNLPYWGEPAYTLPVMLNFVIVLACQVYRYRRVSTAVERQQTKWFLFGFGVIVAFIPFSVYVDAAGRRGYLNDINDYLLWTPLYFGLAIAILRYRLYDIDIIIRKTLQYGLLSALLALVYFGSVVLLQTVLGATVSDSPLLVVISTLLIAALFTPLRRRVQGFIDRRFFRRKYDAQQVLAEFARHARDEVELEALTAELIDVVQESMQPERVGVWLELAPLRPLLTKEQ